MKELIKTPES